MGRKQPETPLPRGTDTALLGWLTSVRGGDDLGFKPPPSIERLFMRLRIFWFFIMAIPIVIASFVASGLASALATLVVGHGTPEGDAITTVAGIAGFAAGLVIGVWFFARWFDRLTRRYRARLEARAHSEPEARRPASRRSAAPAQPSLAELDARLGRGSRVRERTD